MWYWRPQLEAVMTNFVFILYDPHLNVQRLYTHVVSVMTTYSRLSVMFVDCVTTDLCGTRVSILRCKCNN